MFCYCSSTESLYLASARTLWDFAPNQISLEIKLLLHKPTITLCHPFSDGGTQSSPTTAAKRPLNHQSRSPSSHSRNPSRHLCSSHTIWGSTRHICRRRGRLSRRSFDINRIIPIETLWHLTWNALWQVCVFVVGRSCVRCDPVADLSAACGNGLSGACRGREGCV